MATYYPTRYPDQDEPPVPNTLSVRLSVFSRAVRWLQQVMCRHDDMVQRTSGAMFMECTKCNRQTTGWNLRGEGIGK